MHIGSLLRGRLVRAGLLLTVVAALAVPLAAGATANVAHHGRHHQSSAKPTIVLVHGAWAGPSSWNGEIERLQSLGYQVIAPLNPLQSVQGDSAYLKSVLATISGPIVLVGHSYGGMIITNAATGNPNVKALVYINAFAPAEGESVNSIEAMNPGSELSASTVTVRPSPEGNEVYINPSSYRSVFCGDVSAQKAAVLAATQQPLNAAAEADTSGPPAWATIPSWYLVGTNDKAIPPATQEFMAHRMHATTVEIPSSHCSLVSHPEAVTRLIVEAAESIK